MEEGKPRIAIFVSDTNPGGIETIVQLLVKNINREKYRVIVVTTGSGSVAQRIGSDADEFHNLQTGSMPHVSKFKNGRYHTNFLALPVLLIWLIKSVWRMIWWIRKNKIVLIHSHISAFSFIGGLAGKIAGVPLIWHVHCPQNQRWSRGGPFLINGYLSSWLATCFVANSSFTAEQIHHSWRKKTIVVLNCTDVNFVASNQHRGELRKMAGVSENERLVGIIALVSARKGLPRFIDMASKVVQKRQDVKFIIVAGILNEMSEKIMSDLTAMGKNLGIEDKLCFVRNIESASCYMGDMDAFFMCSLKGTEPFGLVVTEAMAAGVPVVAFANDAMPEIIEEGKTGFLVPEGDMDSAAKWILRILEDDNLSSQIAEAGRQRAYENFDIPVFIRNIESVYKKVL